MNLKTFYQAVLFGIVVTLVGLLLSMVLGALRPSLPKACEEWDKYYVMESLLFGTGFIVRYLMVNEHVVSYLYEKEVSY